MVWSLNYAYYLTDRDRNLLSSIFCQLMSSTLRKTQKFLVPFLETQKLLIRWTITISKWCSFYITKCCAKVCNICGNLLLYLHETGAFSISPWPSEILLAQGMYLFYLFTNFNFFRYKNITNRTIWDNIFHINIPTRN